MVEIIKCKPGESGVDMTWKASNTRVGPIGRPCIIGRRRYSSKREASIAEKVGAPSIDRWLKKGKTKDGRLARYCI